LNNIVLDIQNHREVKSVTLRVGLFNSIIPSPPRTKSWETMGEKFIDQALCTQCSKSVKDCPYNAIEMKDFQVFNMEKCYGCWSCYNHCPVKAIHTRKFRGKGHYSKSSEELKRKLYNHLKMLMF
jgi:Fe-S-cluster-containing hydrogenase component 2